SCSFNPSSVTPSSAGATSELTVFTTSVTPTGSFQVQVTGSPLGATTTPTTFTLTVTPPSSSHATFTAVSCGPPTVAVNDVTSCFAAVIDTASGPTTPTGTVTFTPSGTCILAGTGTGASATCLVGITPTATGSLSVSASYDGDSTHAASSGKFFITVSPGVAVTISSNPTVSSPLTFTATVTGGTSPYTFSWDFGDGSLSGTGNPVTHTYDSSGAKTVTLGVTDASGGSVVLSDTWEFTAGTWTQLSSSTSPSPRFLASTAYDVADGYVLLFGGSNITGGTTSLGDTWKFHSSVWTLLSPTSSPSPRAGASMVYDSADGYVLLFGGSLQGDTWEFHAGAWTQPSPPTSPSSRAVASMAYNDADRQAVLFGGVGASPPTQSTTTINVAGQLLPPAQASQNLIDAIKSIQLPGSAQTSLLGPLNNIVKILSDKDPTNDISACNKLSSFINIVNNDQRKGILTIEQAAQLRQLATSIMTQLGC